MTNPIRNASNVGSTKNVEYRFNAFFIVSDHGLIVGENVPPLLGEYGGLNVPVMEQLGYTVMKTDVDGNRVVDWEKTRAVQIRSNYIYVNLKGRDAHGIVDSSEKYALEEQIISDLYIAAQLPEAIKRAFSTIRQSDCIGWFRSCGYVQ